ncbi:lysozyme [EBPR siphovirus 2]|nr:lysozyme [EBPR siphovirus 2]
MRVSDQGLAEIMSHEAIVLSPYLDSVNVLTIGIGHTKAAGPPDPATVTQPLTVSEAVDLFRRDLVKYEKEVTKALKRPVAQHQFDALVSFHFNTGGIAKAALTRHINAGNMDAAAKAFMGWVKPAEIIGRRTKEMVLFRDGTYSHDGTVNVIPITKSRRPDSKRGQRVSVASLLGTKNAAKPALPAPKPAPVKATPLPVTYPKGQVLKVQKLLAEKGWPVGKLDDDLGPTTGAAIVSFRMAHTPMLEPITPTIDAQLISALENFTGSKPVSSERASATVTDLKKKGDPTIVTAGDIQTGAIGLGAFASLGKVDQDGQIDAARRGIENLGAARDFGDQVLDLMQWAAQRWWLPVLMIVAYLLWKVWRVKQQRLKEHRTGQNLAL